MGLKGLGFYPSVPSAALGTVGVVLALLLVERVGLKGEIRVYPSVPSAALPTIPSAALGGILASFCCFILPGPGGVGCLGFRTFCY